jgi:AcrR family transcriptional regulator
MTMELEILNRARGRKRDEATRKAILRAAFDIIAADGYRALTMEGVAGRSGAGKTTVYRWWPTKAALATDALFAEWNTGAADQHRTDSAINDIRTGMHLLAENMSGTNGQVLSCILGGGRDDPETVRMFKEKIAGPKREMGRACLLRGIESGEFRADIDVDVTLDALFLPIFVRLMMGLGAADVAWVDRLTDTVLFGIAARARASAETEPAPSQTVERAPAPTLVASA